MVTQYVMKAFKTSAPTGEVYWATLNSPDLTGEFSEYNPDELTDIIIDYSLEVPISASLGFTGESPSLAGGDLTGTYPSPTVAKLQTKNISTNIPSDGEVLTWVEANSNWEPLPPTGGGGGAPSGPAGGDLSGTYPNPIVAKINSATVPAAGSLTTGNILQVTGVNALSYGSLNLAGGSNYVTGTLPNTNLPDATTGAKGIIQIAGDISGTATSITVSKIQNRNIDSSAPSDGYVLTWITADAYWAPREAAGGGGSPTGSAGGDLSGTYPNPIVAKANGATVPAAGALTIGNVLQVSGASALSYGALNLAGGSNYVTGTLPTGNQAAQSLGGDLSGTTSSSTVIKINGTSVPSNPSADQILVATGGTTSMWSQIYDGYVAASANITGSKIASATTGALGVVQLAGDLAGTATSVTVTGLQTYDVASISPTDGYVLTWSQGDGYWVPRLTTNKMVTAVITNNYNVLTNDQFIAVGATSGSITITLPSSPAVGVKYIIKDQNGLAGSNNIIVDGNGSNIDGSSTFTIDEAYGSITLSFANSRWGII